MSARESLVAMGVGEGTQRDYDTVVRELDRLAAENERLRAALANRHEYECNCEQPGVHGRCISADYTALAARGAAVHRQDHLTEGNHHEG